MTSKEKLEALNYTWFYEPTCQEDADKREAIIKELETDLEVLNILKQLAKGVIELKNNNIDITKYVVLISESTNEKLKAWLDA